MKLRWKLLLTFIALVVAPLLLIWAMHLKVKHDLASYKKRLIASGEKLTIAEWIPRPATNGDAARVFLESVRPFSSINYAPHPSIMRMVAVGRAQATWKSDEIYDSNFKMRTNIWEMIRGHFEGNAETLEELRASTESGEVLFSIAYGQGFRALLPHLMPVKQGAVWLSLAAVYELHEGDKIEAKENLIALLRLLKNYKGEPLVISHLVRIACVNIAFSATWATLQYPDWNDQELREFQEAWNAIEFDNLEATFAMERAMQIQMFTEARISPQMVQAMAAAPASTNLLDELNEFAGEVMENPKAALRALLRSRSWPWLQSYQEEWAMLKAWQVGLEANRAIEQRQYYQPTLKTLMQRLESEGWDRDPDFLFGGSGDLVSRTLTKVSSAKIARQLALTACALQRYNLANGHHPTELKQLIPKFLTAVPLDPIDGQPLRYRLNQDGTFLLYSIGGNGIDDGGDPSSERSAVNQKWIRPLHPMQGRDWVWPLVATEEEIIEWERHESGVAK